MIEYVSVLHSPATRPRYDPHHLTGLKISKYSRISRHPPASCPVPELAEGPWRRPSPVMLGHDLVTHQSAPNGQIWCASATYYRPSARIGRLWCSSDPVFLPSARIGPFWCSSGNIQISFSRELRSAEGTRLITWVIIASRDSSGGRPVSGEISNNSSGVVLEACCQPL